MLHMVKRMLSATALIGFALALAACGGGGGGDGTDKTTYTIGGSLSGLGDGLTVTLLNNGGNALTRSSNGAFTFTTPLAKGAAYAVSVGTQPAGQSCTVGSGTGTVGSANVTNVAVTCVTNTYTVGGTLSGLGEGLSITLLNNGGNSLTRSANGAFTFSASLANGTAYSVTVGTQPTGQACTVANGAGTISSANVSNITVTCSSNAYTIGGTVSGLGAGLSVGLLNNGGNALTVNANGAFTFSTPIASGAAYAVTVGTQPAGQSCSVSNGTGTVAAANITNVGVTCNASNVWAWKGGSNLVAPAGVYGTKGVPAAGNAPGGRNWNGSWKDASGHFWIFGGQGYDSVGWASVINDLWEYNPTTGIWTWTSGADTANAIGVYGTKGVASADNVPGAREFVTSWSDAAGNLWMFGGFGFDIAGSVGYLNDLWKYNPSTGQWTWVGGANVVDAGGVYGSLGTEAASNQPGARWGAVSWTDAAGFVWMFGGYGVDSGGVALGYLNDLWRYNPTNGRWTWMSGSNTYGATGVYGTKGIPAAGNVPGCRNNMSAISDSSGNLWLYGGIGDDGSSTVVFNDLWKYTPSTGQWTWVSGSNVPNAGGVYGTMGTAAATNVPGARGGMVVWTDNAGRFWVFGGWGFDSQSGRGELSDLWRYDVATGYWTWVNGSTLRATAGVYGTLGTPSVSTQPGGRDSGTAWIDSNGHVWLFGGAGYDSTGAYDSYGLNDIFEYFP